MLGAEIAGARIDADLPRAAGEPGGAVEERAAEAEVVSPDEFDRAFTGVRQRLGDRQQIAVQVQAAGHRQRQAEEGEAQDQRVAIGRPVPRCQRALAVEDVPILGIVTGVARVRQEELPAPGILLHPGVVRAAGGEFVAARSPAPRRVPEDLLIGRAMAQADDVAPLGGVTVADNCSEIRWISGLVARASTPMSAMQSLQWAKWVSGPVGQ